jgi:hypothetical protein
MPAASIDLTATNIYGANYGNFKEANVLPGEQFTRSRLIKTSAIKPYGASAGVGYKIFNVPSYTLITNVMGVVVASNSADVATTFAIGDADASTTWISDVSLTALGPPQLVGLAASWDVGMSIFGPSNFFVGKFYSNGGEIQAAILASEAVAQVWVTIQGINLKPV